MPLYRKRSPKLRFQFVPSQKQSTLGGLPALEALAQQFDLWNKLRRLPSLDPRTRTSHGYSPRTDRRATPLLFLVGRREPGRCRAAQR